MNKVLPAIKKDKIVTAVLITAILLLAVCLRLYHPFAIPYTYDELSALFRTDFNNFSDLIAKGVVVDSHPAGIQVFLYYWTKLVGYRELYVKLPFIIFGILSVFYVFKIGSNWFNPTVGLVCAAYMATLQYLIMHSQEARPYMSGLFFTVAMVWHWSNMIFKPEKRFELNWALYILFSALCAYNHYFSLLFAGIVGLTGIFFIKKRYILRCVTAGIMIFVLFIPHLHIFFYQLIHLKGIGQWLDKPKPEFVLNYLEYVFHFSPYVYACVAGLFCWGLIHAIIHKTFPGRFLLISFTWFLLPLIIGFLYSVYRDPVLEYRVLLFSFPFFFFSIFGLLPDVRPVLKTGVITVICVANIVSLVYNRKYYQLYYQSPFSRVCALTDSVTRTVGKNAMLRFIESDSNTAEAEHFYIKRDHRDTTFISLDNSTDKTALVDYLEDHPREYLSYGCTSEADAVYLPVFLNYYPYVVKQYNFFGGNFYILTSVPGKYKLPDVFKSIENFDTSPSKGWTIGNNPPITDTIHFSGKYSYKMDSLHEYGPTFTCSLKDMISMKNDFIAVSAEIFPEDSDMSNAVLVASLESGGKTINWSGASMKNFIFPGEKRRWIKVYNAIKLSDINIDYPNVQLKVYIWNKGRKNFYIDDFEVNTIKGNPYLYGVIEKLQ